MSEPERRLAELGLTLPVAARPVANYVPFVRVGDLLHISGQVSNDASGGIRGVVGQEIGPEAGRDAARLCGVNLIAQMKAALDGDLGRVRRIVKINGFVQAGPEFFDIPQVLNGCSDLMVEVFGDLGRHARSAVGVYRLPLNFAVEADAVVQVA
jgi:enamine deaminase RidA (YjgF/YER057c/UK114 family)